MKLFFSVILIYFYIFGVRNIIDYKDVYFKVFNELKDRQEIESISTSHYSSSSVLFRSDLSVCAQFNKCIMRNSTESRQTQNNNNLVSSKKSSSSSLNKLSTFLGFCECYFSYLPNSRSQNEAFVKVSVDYYNIYQSFKFSSFNQFKTALYGSVN